MRQVSFSEVTNILNNIRNAKSNTLKIDVWRRYLNKFQERHKNKVQQGPNRQRVDRGKFYHR